MYLPNEQGLIRDHVNVSSTLIATEARRRAPSYMLRNQSRLESSKKRSRRTSSGGIEIPALSGGESYDAHVFQDKYDFIGKILTVHEVGYPQESNMRGW